MSRHLLLHTALDDHSRLTYTETLADEKAATCAEFLRRAHAWFAGHGIRAERVLSDNAWSYRKNTWRQTCHDLDIGRRFTRPWRPQTNGKVERFHRTLLDEWAYQHPHQPETERQIAFTDWLHWYNFHRPHTAIHGATQPTASPTSPDITARPHSRCGVNMSNQKVVWTRLRPTGCDSAVSDSTMIASTAA